MNFKYPKWSLAWVGSVVVLSNVKTLKNRKVFHVLLNAFLCCFCELKKTITLQRFRITHHLRALSKTFQDLGFSSRSIISSPFQSLLVK